jgi:hypothetical protein
MLCSYSCELVNTVAEHLTNDPNSIEQVASNKSSLLLKMRK